MRRFFAILLTMCIVIGMLPASALAAEACKPYSAPFTGINSCSVFSMPTSKTEVDKGESTTNNASHSCMGYRMPTGVYAYYLSCDLALDAPLIIPSGCSVYLCTHGHNIIGSSTEYVIRVMEGGRLIINNCKANSAESTIRNASSSILHEADIIVEGYFEMGSVKLDGAKSPAKSGVGIYGNGQFAHYGTICNYTARSEFDFRNGIYMDYFCSGNSLSVFGILSNNHTGVDVSGSVDYYNRPTVTLNGCYIANNTTGINISGNALVNMTGGTISGNSSGFYLMGNQATAINDALTPEINITGGTISGNKDGIFSWHGKVTTANTTITENTSSGITAWESESIVLNSGTVVSKNGSDTTEVPWDRCGISLRESDLTATGASIVENYGPGIYAYEDPYQSITLNSGCSVSGNQGDGIHITAGNLLINYAGGIRDNQGIGVYLQDGTFTLGGSSAVCDFEITRNKQGGVYLWDGASFTMNDGDITGNGSETFTGNGAGVFVGDGSSFIMKEGKISGNETTGNGGGVYVGEDSSFTMEDKHIDTSTYSYIQSNSAAKGGGIYVAESGTATLKGGTIGGSYKNTATQTGAGIYLEDGSKLVLAEGLDILIDNNRMWKSDGSWGTESNVCLEGTYSIVIQGTPTIPTPISVRTVNDIAEGQKVNITTYNSNSESYAEKFAAENSKEAVGYDNGYIVLRGQPYGLNFVFHYTRADGTEKTGTYVYKKLYDLYNFDPAAFIASGDAPSPRQINGLNPDPIHEVLIRWEDAMDDYMLYSDWGSGSSIYRVYHDGTYDPEGNNNSFDSIYAVRSPEGTYALYSGHDENFHFKAEIDYKHALNLYHGAAQTEATSGTAPEGVFYNTSNNSGQLSFGGSKGYVNGDTISAPLGLFDSALAEYLGMSSAPSSMEELIDGLKTIWKRNTNVAGQSIPDVLVGLTADAAARNKVYGAGDTLPALYDGSALTFADEDITLYAVWACDKNKNRTPDCLEKDDPSFRKVIYTDGVDNAEVFPDEIYYVVEGETLPRPKVAPTDYSFREQYRVAFKYWLDSSGTKWDHSGLSGHPAVTDDVTFTAKWDTMYLISFDVNGGTIAEGSVNPEMVEGDLITMGYITQEDLVRISGIYNELKQLASPPAGSEGPVIFAGLAVDSAVEDVIYSHDDPPAPSVVIYNADNMATYQLRGDTVVYYVWAYDNNGNGIPDYKESEITYFIVTVDANGGQYNPDNSEWVATREIPLPLEDSGGGATLPWPGGTPEQQWESVKNQFRYLDANDQPAEDILWMGVTTNPAVKGKIYGAGDRMIPDSDFITGSINVPEDLTIYVVWAYDKNGNGTPDYQEMNLFLDFNGGYIDENRIGEPGEGISFEKTNPSDTFYSRMRASGQLGKLPGAQDTVSGTLGDSFSNMSYSEIVTALDFFVTAPADTVIVGYTMDSAAIGKIFGVGGVNDLPTLYNDEPLTFNSHITLYAVWAEDKLGDEGTPDYLEDLRPSNPGTPELAEVTLVTSDSITVKVEQGQQYKLGEGEWITPEANGTHTFVGLTKNTPYIIQNRFAETAQFKASEAVEQAVTTKALTAADIAKTFVGENDTTTYTPTSVDSSGNITWESAENDKVTVTVDPTTGNYVVTLQKDIQGTITIPDTWGDVILDLNGHTITGTDGDARNPNGKPGIEIKSGGGNGTHLNIINSNTKAPGAIIGGNGAEGGNGGAGVLIESTNSDIDVGANVTITGGSGGNGTGGSASGNTGNITGGAGVDGNVGTNNGTITGGNGGDGTNGGNGGNGGNGVTGDVGTNSGSITGGSGGDGSDGSGNSNGGSGGNGGNGVTGNVGTNTSTGTITGGSGGDGGNSTGSGGTGGAGGAGVDGSVTTNNGTITGGNGGDQGGSNTPAPSDPVIPVYPSVPVYPVLPDTGHDHSQCDGKKENGCYADAFKDVDTTQWYHEALDYVLGEGLMNGIGGDLFDPNGTTSRAMIVTILWRLEGSPIVDAPMSYRDVESGSWYSEAVRWATWAGIVEGYSDELFGPVDAVTREQMAALLYRYARYKGMDVSDADADLINSFADALTVSGWAMSAMQWAVGSELMQGDGVNLTPTANSTRSQCAALLMRFAELNK